MIIHPTKKRAVIAPARKIPALGSFSVSEASTPRCKVPPILGSAAMFKSASACQADEELVKQLAAEFDEEPADAKQLGSQRHPDDATESKVSITDGTAAGLVKGGSNKPVPESRYVSRLVKASQLREAELEMVHERNTMKEILAEGINPSDTFVTKGYRRRLVERAAIAVKLAERETAHKTTGDFQRRQLLLELASGSVDSMPQQGDAPPAIERVPTETLEQDTGTMLARERPQFVANKADEQARSAPALSEPIVNDEAEKVRDKAALIESARERFLARKREAASNVPVRGV